MDIASTNPCAKRFLSGRATRIATRPDAFMRPTPGLRLIGVLSPLLGADAGVIHLHDEVTNIGRDETSTLRLRDQLVSRHHARITRVGEHFQIEDLCSINGTFVDGVPVVACQLHDGDTIQVGKSLFYFDRLYERAPQPPFEVPVEDRASASGDEASPDDDTAPTTRLAR